MPSPSEETIIEIRNALGCPYDPDEDAKVTKQLYDLAKFTMTFMGLGIGALVTSGFVPKSQSTSVGVLILYMTPLIVPALVLMVVCMIDSTAPAQRKTIQKVDRAAFEVYDHARKTGNCSQVAIAKILSRHALPKHVQEGMAQKCARIEYILQDALAAALA